MEEIWKMDVMDKEYFRGTKKYSLVNPDVQFAYFSCILKGGIERFFYLLNNYRFNQDVCRFNDPKGIISAQRRARSLGTRSHHFYFQEDVIRNLSTNEEVNARKDAWRKIYAI